MVCIYLDISCGRMAKVFKIKHVQVINVIEKCKQESRIHLIRIRPMCGDRGVSVQEITMWANHSISLAYTFTNTQDVIYIV